MFQVVKGAVSVFCAGILAVAALACGALAGPIKVDFVFVVDESDNFDNVGASLVRTFSVFSSILADEGIDAQYALIGFGDGDVDPRLLTDLTTASGFELAAGGLTSDSGSIEPGYAAIASAVNALSEQTFTVSLRPEAFTNIVLFTNEPSNGDDAYSQFGSNPSLNATILASLLSDVGGVSVDAFLSDFGSVGFPTSQSYAPLLGLELNGDVAMLPQDVFAGGPESADAQMALLLENYACDTAQEYFDLVAPDLPDQTFGPACTPDAVSVDEPGALGLVGFALMVMSAAYGRRRRFSVQVR